MALPQRSQSQRSDARGPARPRPAPSRRTRHRRPASRRAADRSRRGIAFHDSTPRIRWSGGRAGEHASVRPPTDIRHRQAQRRVERRQVRRADDAQEFVGLAVAAEQCVLAVVEPQAGLPIRERRGPPAQPRCFFDDGDAHPAMPAMPAASPAQPAPTTTTWRASVLRDSATAKRPPGAKGQPRLRRPRHPHELTEHVVVGRFNPLEQLEVDAVHDFGSHEARGIAARQRCHSAGEVFAGATRLLSQRRTDLG